MSNEMSHFNRPQYEIFKSFLDLYMEYERAYRDLFIPRSRFEILPMTTLEFELIANGRPIEFAVGAALARNDELRSEGFQEISKDDFLEKKTRLLDLYESIRPLIFNKTQKIFVTMCPEAKELVNLLMRTPSIEMVEEEDPTRFVYVNSARLSLMLHRIRQPIEDVIAAVRASAVEHGLGDVIVQNPRVDVCMVLAIDQTRTVLRNQHNRRVHKKGLDQVWLDEDRDTFKCDNPPCPNMALSECSHCKIKSYCSRECQIADYREHKPYCKGVSAIMENCGRESASGAASKGGRTRRKANYKSYLKKCRKSKSFW